MLRKKKVCPPSAIPRIYAQPTVRRRRRRRHRLLIYDQTISRWKVRPAPVSPPTAGTLTRVITVPVPRNANYSLLSIPLM